MSFINPKLYGGCIVIAPTKVRDQAMKNAPGQKQPGQGAQAGCAKYSENEFRRYLGGEMMSQEIDEFEAHCSSCNGCLRLLYRSQVEILKENEARAIEKLLDKTKKKRQELERPEPANDFFGGRGMK